MKKLIIVIILISSNFHSFCQKPPGTPEYTMAMFNKITAWKSYIDEQFGDTFTIRRIETGILYNLNNQLLGETQRKLFSGHKYMILAFTDARVNDLKLKVYKDGSGNDWTYLTTVDKNTATTSSSGLIGDFEITSLSPTEDITYKFEISCPSKATNSSARYSIMVFSTDVASTSSSTPTVYNIDNYTTKEWDYSKKAYSDWSSPKNYSCTFELNSEKTVITWKSSNSAPSTYYITDIDNSDKWFNYKVKASNGNRYMIMFPKSNDEYVRFYKIDDQQNNTLFDYHIQANNAGSTTQQSASTFYSTDQTMACFYNTQTKKFDKCDDAKNDACLFEINSNHTMIKHTTSSITSQYFVQDRTYVSDNKWFKYKVVSDVGNTYYFLEPDDNYEYFTTLKDDGDNSYIIKYHIRRKWTQN